MTDGSGLEAAHKNREGKGLFAHKALSATQAGERWWDLIPFDRRLRALKKDFQRNVGPSLRRHRYFLSKGERGRLKHERAMKRLRKQRFGRTYG
jgi:ribosomal protein S21